jgi:di/tricarboxylate transporter
MNTDPHPAPVGDDWLDDVLRSDGQSRRIDSIVDDGFTARVAAALPPPATPPAWRKPALAGLWAAAGIGTALALPGALSDVAREVFRMLGSHPVGIADVAAGVAAWGAATVAATAWALRDDWVG